jgi:hypothetical protein
MQKSTQPSHVRTRQRLNATSTSLATNEPYPTRLPIDPKLKLKEEAWLLCEGGDIYDARLYKVSTMP